MQSAPDEGLSPHTQIARGCPEEGAPSPGLHLAMQSDLSHKGRGALPMRLQDEQMDRPRRYALGAQRT